MKRVPIGEFSRMTHLSIKTLRHYHDVDLLAPDAIDPFTGYRYYAISQIRAAQVIRRLRALGVPVDEVRSILAATDPESRGRVISAHLERLERQLEHTTAAVASLRALLDCSNVALQIDHRTVPDTDALAISERVRHEGILSWWRAAFTEIRDGIRALGVEPAGPAGGLYHTELFSEDEGDATVFIPVREPTRTVGRAAPIVIPAAELAVTLHAGSHDDIDGTYGALGAYVQEHEISIDGPVREFYLVDRFQTDAAAEWRTEIGWPIFQARARSSPTSSS
jgi:DNA-binding transcriptional MerR regulator